MGKPKEKVKGMNLAVSRVTHRIKDFPFKQPISGLPGYGSDGLTRVLRKARHRSTHRSA